MIHPQRHGQQDLVRGHYRLRWTLLQSRSLRQIWCIDQVHKDALLRYKMQHRRYDDENHHTTLRVSACNPSDYGEQLRRMQM